MLSWCRIYLLDGSRRIRAKTKLHKKPREACKSSWNPRGNQKSFYTDKSLEFGKACEDLSWNHCTSTPHRSETNGIAERAVRRVKEGTSAVLLQSGLNESCWADSQEWDTYLRNVTDLLSDGKTPYERRFGQPFKGPIIPFGSLVEFHPITAKDQSRIHQFGKKVLLGLFLGYALYAGGLWKGDVLIADLEELETMDASEIYSKRLNAKEVIFPKQGEFIVTIADGRINTPGGDQELRTSTLIRPRPIQGEGHVDFLGESEGSLPQTHDSLPVAGEAMNDFWSMSGSFIYRHHVEPRVALYSLREESFLIPLKRAQQGSGEERVTAKLRPMMNLQAKMPSVVSSSTSSSLGRTSYGYQDPERHVLDDSNPLKCQDQTIYKRVMVYPGLLKSGKVEMESPIDRGNLRKLLGI